MLDIKPFTTRLIVKQKEVKQVGLIIIPENAKSMEATEGTVVAAGEEVSLVGVGDSVFYGRYAGFKLERAGEEYRMMDQADLLGLIQPQGEQNAG